VKNSHGANRLARLARHAEPYHVYPASQGRMAPVNEGKKAQPRPRDRLVGVRYMNRQPQKAPKGIQKWQPIR
jgi:hypothetical protein